MFTILVNLPLPKRWMGRLGISHTAMVRLPLAMSIPYVARVGADIV
jgi:hypothetical protein